MFEARTPIILVSLKMDYDSGTRVWPSLFNLERVRMKSIHWSSPLNWPGWSPISLWLQALFLLGSILPSLIAVTPALCSKGSLVYSCSFVPLAFKDATPNRFIFWTPNCLGAYFIPETGL